MIMKKKMIRKNVLLIGSAQQGKSSLGNILVCGENPPPDRINLPFQTGDSTESCTTDIKSSEIEINFQVDSDTVRKKIRIIDTPGIGDSNEEKEEENMLSVFQYLSSLKDRMEEIAFVLLVVRYRKLIDNEFQRNISFYQKMFPDVFRDNIMLVVTDFEKTEKFIRRMRNSGCDCDLIIKKIQKRVSEILGMKYEIITKTVDSFALKEEKENYKNTMDVRNYILERACSIRGVQIQHLQLPKTYRMIANDKEEIQKIDGKIERLSTQLVSTQQNLQTLLQQIMVLDGEITDLDTKSASMRRDLIRFSYGNVIEREISACESFCFFSIPKATFEYTSQYEIMDATVIGGHFIHKKIDGRKVEGQVGKRWLFSRLNATVSVYVRKVDVNRLRIEELEADMNEITLSLEEKRRLMEDLKARDPEEKLKEVTQKIGALKNEKKNLERDTCSVMDYVKCIGGLVRTRDGTFFGKIDGGSANSIGCYGEMKYNDGRRYVGEFKNGLREGKGECTMEKGGAFRYAGMYKDDELNGHGVGYFPDGSRYEGEFRDGKKNGHGVYTFPDGRVFEGKFRDGKRNGEGLYTYPNGERFAGQYKDGKRNGEGMYTYPDGRMLGGEFKDDKVNGLGICTFPDGRIYKGEFKDGERNGDGVFIASDGRRYLCKYETGKLVKFLMAEY